MTDSILFRIDLDGTKVPVKWREMHEVRRDILHYFEENLHEPTNVYVIPEYSKHEYWKYLTVCYEREYAETRRYCWLFERGCLALLNGLSLDILNEQLWPGSNLWGKGKGIAESCLPYLKSYQPKEPLLNEGKQMLIEAMSFISAMSADELDEDGYPKFVTTDQGGWFTKNIIGDTSAQPHNSISGDLCAGLRPYPQLPHLALLVSFRRANCGPSSVSIKR